MIEARSPASRGAVAVSGSADTAWATKPSASVMNWAGSASWTK